jgi:hypothetical protein
MALWELSSLRTRVRTLLSVASVVRSAMMLWVSNAQRCA